MVNVVLRAESMRPLHSGRHAIGPDLVPVEADMKAPVLKVNVAALVSRHGFRLAKMRQECNSHSLRLNKAFSFNAKSASMVATGRSRLLRRCATSSRWWPSP
jgi:hypothetical protein